MTIIAIPHFEDNYAYLVQSSRGSILFDCGEGKTICDILLNMNVAPDVLLLTHNHHDHIDGISHLRKTFPLTKVITADQAVRGEFDQIDTIPVTVLATPGHTLDSVCYYLPEQSAIITGDTLFSGGCGRCFSGEYDLFCESLGTLAKLPQETKIYPAHEYLKSNVSFLKSMNIDCSFYELRCKTELFPSVGITLGEELLLNPFLQAGSMVNHEEFRRLRIAKNLF